jgi:Holliday junction resolvasome RuvABC ATP-dependent DNA helicase subunit
LRYAEIIGQDEAVTRLKGFGEFYATRETTPGHILLCGPDAMGQSLIAATFANEVGRPFQVADARKLEIIGDMTALLTNFKVDGTVLLMANIHLLRKIHLERMAQVMRDSKLEIVIGQGPAARTHIFDVRPFTLIATCPRKVDCPLSLLGEFALTLDLRPYSQEALSLIAERLCASLAIRMEQGVSDLLARASNGSPGGIEVLLRRLRAVTTGDILTSETVKEAFAVFGIARAIDPAPDGSVNLGNLSGVDFEKVIADLLDRIGFRAELTKASGDGGIDIIATLDRTIFGGRYLFQCKRFAHDNLVGAPTLRDFYGAVTADRAVKGVFITTSGFTVQAREFGERVGLELIDAGKLETLMSEYGIADRTKRP